MKLNYAQDKYEIVNEELTINEFRRLVEGTIVNIEVQDAVPVEANPNDAATGTLKKIKIGNDVFAIDAGAFAQISAPSSTTLTDDEIDIIKKGASINGQFLGYAKPVLFPAVEEVVAIFVDC